MSQAIQKNWKLVFFGYYSGILIWGVSLKNEESPLCVCCSILSAVIS